MTTLIYVFVFGNVANISTDGVPKPLFYMSGIVLWNYFSECFMRNSDTFSTNSEIFGKVYFPRLITPISLIISNAIKFLIQFFLFLVVYIYYLSKGANVHPQYELIALPFLIGLMALMGLGFGLIFSSLTTKYKDLKFLIQFGVQLLMYATPIIYPIVGKTNMYMKGFIDLVMYNSNTGKYFIYDFKTSTRGWTDKEKKDETKSQQIILYKKFFSDLYKVDLDMIEVEFIILKRKLFESKDFVIPRIQGFQPAAGKIKLKKTLDSFQEFLQECFTPDGLFNYEKKYPMNIGSHCKWCAFGQNGMCTKGEEKKQFFV
jgi:hypothetical protein